MNILLTQKSKKLNHARKDKITTPGDMRSRSRQVPTCWSRVLPTPSPNPKLRLWSEEVKIEEMEIDSEGRTRRRNGPICAALRWPPIWQLGRTTRRWSGNYSGRGTSDGILELQLKGSGQTPFKILRGKAVLIDREFLCMKQCIMEFQPLVCLVTTGEQVSQRNCLQSCTRFQRLLNSCYDGR